MISQSAPVIQILVVGVRYEYTRLLRTISFRYDQARVGCPFGAHVSAAEPRRIARKGVSRVLDGFLLRDDRRQEIRVLPVLLLAQEASINNYVVVVHEYRTFWKG